MFSLHMIRAATHWSAWLNEELEVELGFFLPRYKCIEGLVTNAILPTLKAKGYSVSCSEVKLSEYIARCIYFGHRRRVPPSNPDYFQEDIDHYFFLMDDDTWDTIWDNSSGYVDIDEEHYKNRVLIRMCVWSQMNLDNSSATKEVDELLGISEDDNTTSNRTGYTDPYLHDAAQGYFNPV